MRQPIKFYVDEHVATAVLSCLPTQPEPQP